MARPSSEPAWITSTETHPWQKRSTAAVRRRGTQLKFLNVSLQNWRGFGGCFNELGWLALSQIPAAKRRKVLDALFNTRTGCAFNLCRLPIGASDYAAEWYSHNESAGDYAMRRFSIARDKTLLIPYIREALKRRPDLQLFASPWSPPTWMKYPRAYNHGRLIWKKEILKAYALYFAKFVQAYAREGVRIHQVHVQNEPLADQKFPSCLWSGEHLRDFIRDYLGPRFRQDKLDCEIWLGTLNTDDHCGYAHTVLADARARSYVGGVGYQWAGKGAVQRTHQAWPEIPILQTENECGDGQNTWDYALYVFSLMQHYINNGVVGYTYWNMVLPPRGVSTWGWLQNAMITVDPESGTVCFNPEFHVMKHFSRFVRPGATVRLLEGRWKAMSVAFRNPDGRDVLLVGNPFPQAQELTVERHSRQFRAELPPRSVNTFVW